MHSLVTDRLSAPQEAPRVAAADPLIEQRLLGRQNLADDMVLLRAAADLAREFAAPSPRIYWTDFLLSAAVGYAGLAGAILFASPWIALACGVVAVLALYRAELFIHEVSHIKHSALPGFRLGWNLIAGIPLMVPSFMYEGVHNLHHARTRYGTKEDPEYLPLASMTSWTLPIFLGVALLAPVGVLLRFAVLAPLSLVVPGLRRVVVERYSGLQINPEFKRRAPEGEARRIWHGLEIATSLWAISLLALVGFGVVPLRAFLIFLAVIGIVAFINQVRTMVAHLWENDGEPMSVTAQYLDSVNVPPPSLLPFLWAPVGLRYHALHHLLPSVPYHALGKAHLRLVAMLDASSPYHRANHPTLSGLVHRLYRNTVKAGRAR